MVAAPARRFDPDTNGADRVYLDHFQPPPTPRWRRRGAIYRGDRATARGPSMPCCAAPSRARPSRAMSSRAYTVTLAKDAA
jgi:hypothetical protein